MPMPLNITTCVKTLEELNIELEGMNRRASNVSGQPEWPEFDKKRKELLEKIFQYRTLTRWEWINYAGYESWLGLVQRYQVPESHPYADFHLREDVQKIHSKRPTNFSLHEEAQKRISAFLTEQSGLDPDVYAIAMLRLSPTNIEDLGHGIPLIVKDSLEILHGVAPEPNYTSVRKVKGHPYAAKVFLLEIECLRAWIRKEHPEGTPKGMLATTLLEKVELAEALLEA